MKEDKAMRHLGRVRDIAADYDGFVVDLWGVVHDGVHPLPGAADCLRRLREQRKRIVLLSNAPRRAGRAAEMLRQMGIGDELYDRLLTSGEATRSMLVERTDPFFATLGPQVFHLGPERDRNVLDGVTATVTARLDDADWVLNTGPDDENPEPLEKLILLLDRMRERALPMVCANPDLEVIRGGVRVICAGLLAALYADRGGSVRVVGKPDPAIYEEVIRTLGGAPERLAAFGDALATDMKGAAAIGIDGIWVLGGIHEALRGRPDAAEAEAGQAGLAPVATVPRFSW